MRFPRFFRPRVFPMTGCAVAVLLGAAAPSRLVAQAGSMDASFKPKAGANASVVSSALQPDGKIILGGNLTSFNGIARNYVARLNADGSVDTTFDPGTGPDASLESTVLQPDGKIVVAGEFTSIGGVPLNFVARLNADGSLDATFNPGDGADQRVVPVALQPDGKIVIGGDFNSVADVPRNRVARLNADGSLDATFDPGTGVDGVLRAVAVQPDNKILVGGSFTTFGGGTHNRLARLAANGTVEGKTFAPSVNSTVRAIVVQPDNKILIGGDFSTVNSTARSAIARLNPDATLDTTFNPGAGATGYSRNSVYSVLLQPDGKVVIAGQFTAFNGTARNFVARLNANGSLDTSFDTSVGGNEGAYTLQGQPDGKIVVGGNFTTFGGVPTHYVTRLNGDPRGTLQFDADNGRAAESAGIVTLLVTRTGGSTGAVSINYATANGSAQAGSDYMPVSGTLSWPDGDASAKAITVPVINDAVSEEAESFQVVLSAPTGGASLGFPMQATIDITDDDVASATPPPDGGTPAPGGGTPTPAPAALIGEVDLLSPPSELNVLVGEPIDLYVSVVANPSDLAFVEFFANTTSLGGSNAVRNRKTWMPAAAGDYVLTAVATGTDGKQKFSNETIHVQPAQDDASAPDSAVLSGLDGRSFAAGSSVELVASAADAGGAAVRSVRFYADGMLIAAPSAVQTSGTTADGRHRQGGGPSAFYRAALSLGQIVGDTLVTMVAVNDKGIASVSNAVTIHTTASAAGDVLSCAIAGPTTDGRITAGEATEATVTAGKTGGTVSKVEFFVGRTRVGTATGEPYTFVVPPQTAGRYALTAVATDESGVSKVSAPVIVRAADAPPVVTIEAAGGGMAAEGGVGKLLVRRTGDASEALTVRYKVKGSARAGVDFKALSGSVILPADVKQAKIKVKTVENRKRDGARAVKVKLVTGVGGSYTLGGAASAQIKIVDDD